MVDRLTDVDSKPRLVERTLEAVRRGPSVGPSFGTSSVVPEITTPGHGRVWSGTTPGGQWCRNKRVSGQFGRSHAAPAPDSVSGQSVLIIMTVAQTQHRGSMAGNPSRAYLVGSVDLRDRLIAELAAVGITAVAGGEVTGAGREKAKDGPWLVFVRGEPVPAGVVLTALRRCHHHRDRNELSP